MASNNGPAVVLELRMSRKQRLEPAPPFEPCPGLTVGNARRLGAEEPRHRLEHLGRVFQRNTADQVDVIAVHWRSPRCDPLEARSQVRAGVCLLAIRQGL